MFIITAVSSFQPQRRLECRQPVWHHDYIDKHDLPREWMGLGSTVEVEAKAKELSVCRLCQELKEY